jgi:DNA-binding MarR family transcriptional regulator
MENSTLNAWRLFITAHAKLIDKIDSQLAAANQISLSWYDVLIELYEAPEHRLRMHELAEKVVLSRSGLTRLVDRLEKEGFIQRELDPNDRRGFYAIITDKGIEALRAAWPVYAEGISQFFAQHLDDNEAKVLATIFSRMVDK